MTSSPNIGRQRRAGYTLLAGAGLILAGSIIAGLYYGLPQPVYLGALVPTGILAVFGYWAVSASRRGVTLGDELTVELIGKVSTNAFWWLIGILLVDGFLELLPEDGRNTIYVAIGVTIYVLYLGYYVFLK